MAQVLSRRLSTDVDSAARAAFAALFILPKFSLAEAVADDIN